MVHACSEIMQIHVQDVCFVQLKVGIKFQLCILTEFHLPYIKLYFTFRTGFSKCKEVTLTNINQKNIWYQRGGYLATYFCLPAYHLRLVLF